MIECKKYVISGRVQGVFFRESTRRQANKLGIQGQAINLKDGRVEVIAVGSDSALEALETWLNHGPPMAEVISVDKFNKEVCDELKGFITG